MSHRIDKIYENAVSSRLIPGVAVIAGDKKGDILYSKAIGVASLKDGRNDPFTPQTICAIASMSKLMTSVAVLKCVEDGKLSLDQDMRPLLPEMGKYGIMKGFNDETSQANFEPDSTPITMRMLLSHTSGHEYDWLSPLLGKWRASRNEGLWTGPTVADKSALPLMFTPGHGFAYGGGHDWAGRAVEVVTGMTLDEYMREYLWKSVEIDTQTGFYPYSNSEMESKLATISTLNEDGEPPAVDAPFFDILFGGTDCLGGAGIFTSAESYYKFLSAVFRRDLRLLKHESYVELFRPQLDQKLEQEFNDYLASSPSHVQFLSLQVPPTVRKNWSFAGMVVKEALEGQFKEGCTMWGGVPSMMWFMDHEAGTCGLAFVQMIPPMYPAIIALHSKFQGEILSICEGAKCST